MTPAHGLQAALVRAAAMLRDADALAPDVDPATGLMRPLLPACPHCGAPARPNVLIRINPRAPEVTSERDVGIATGALDALRRLRDLLA